jgi:hypothetical protein
MRKIEIDETTAIVLERRAADRGLSVADLVAELTEYATEPADVSDEELAELDRIARDAGKPGGTLAHEDVVRWLETWGTPSYKPWSSR